MAVASAGPYASLTENHASTPLLSFLQVGCASCRPTNSVKALIGSNNKLEIYSKPVENVSMPQHARVGLPRPRYTGGPKSGATDS